MRPLDNPSALARKRDGFILVAVLWILVALSTLAAVYAMYVNSAVVAAGFTDDRIRGDAMITAALELTAFHVTAVPADIRPARGNFSFRVGTANVSVAFQPETARIDLNAASKPLLAGLFMALGASPMNAEFYADRIIGWRTYSKTEDQIADKEALAYRNAGIPYGPREGPFWHVDELWLVMGIPPAFVERALPHVTVYSGRPTVNAIDASPQTLAAMPGMTPERLGEIVKMRAGGRQFDEAVLGLAGAIDQVSAGISRATRVFIEGRLGSGRTVSATVVIMIQENASDPYLVLSWRDDSDGTERGRR